MVFSSLIFLFLFLPVVLTVYHLLFLPVRLGAQRWRWMANLWLMAVSLLFYAWGEPLFVGVMIFSTLIDYTCGLAIAGGFRRGEIKILEKGGARTRGQKAALCTSIVLNLALLGFFKYYDFGVASYSSVMEFFGMTVAAESFLKIALPIGISFFTFQTITYTVDVYRGDAKATRNYPDFACYVTMFPQLVAGPIVRYSSIATQLANRKISVSRFASGAHRFIMGLGKKVLIANVVAGPVKQIFDLPAGQVPTDLAWLGAALFTLQIYFDFSGYSDMAIGLGRMLGFEFPENFNYPYISRSIREFWRRWHITLSTWFRDYLYIPLGGSRKSAKRTYLNLLIVFFLCGLWHGALWSFVVWGLFHGLFLVLERLVPKPKPRPVLRPLAHLYTLLVVMVGWVFFKTEDLSDALSFLVAMGGFAKGSAATFSAGALLTSEVWLALVAGVVLAAPVYPWLVRRWERRQASAKGSFAVLAESAVSMAGLTVLVLVLVVSAMSLAAGTHNPFLYFRF